MKFLHELVDYLHGDKIYEVRSYIMSEIAKTTDNNKGHFWEKCLSKKMSDHTKLLGRNAFGRDFSDNTDAKFATYYRRTDGVFEASVGNIRNKVGDLRVCLCLPGEHYHRLFFLYIPYEAYQRFTMGSDALKFGLSPRGSPTGKLTKYLTSFEGVCRPKVDINSK